VGQGALLALWKRFRLRNAPGDQAGTGAFTYEPVTEGLRSVQFGVGK
jgi:hypothetical protein